MEQLDSITPEIFLPPSLALQKELPGGACAAPSCSNLPLSPEAELARLQNVFQSSPVGLCFLDLDYRYVSVNACLARMYNLPASSFVGRTTREILPAVADQIAERLDPDLAVSGLVEIKIYLERPSPLGADHPPEQLVYLRSSQPVRDLNGNAVGFSIALMDITNRERAEAALRESEENYRYTVDLNPHVPWTTDASGTTLNNSPRLLALLGISAEQAAHQEWQHSLHPEDREATWRAWKHSLVTGSPYDCTYRLPHADGTWRWFRSQAFARRNAKGEILRWYGTLEDIHQRKLLDEALQLKTARLEEVSGQLSLLVREDHLTGLANRRHFDDALEREAARARRSGLPLSLIMIDVDHFKRFNDTYGHPAGDACLKAVAGALGRVLRRHGDLAARYGGEEFVVLLPDTPEEGAIAVARHAHAAVRSLALPHTGSATGALTISVGVAMFQSAPQHTPINTAELLRAADLALYAAKAAGRDRVVASPRPEK